MRLSPLYRSLPDWLTLIILAAVALLAGYALISGLSPPAVPIVIVGLLALLALIGAALLVHGLRLRTLGRDVATSKIASAPQGYVELFGTASPLPAQPLWSDQAWLWRRTLHARQSDILFFRSLPFAMYKPLFWELTDRPFLLRDGSGEAIVLPAGAEVICADRQTVRLEEARVMEESIRPGDDLYVLGHFSSHGSPPDVGSEAERLASDWVGDPEQRKRFDLDRDGYLSVQELLALRAKARATVTTTIARSEPPGVVHTVSRPLDGSRFIISTVSPAALSRHNVIYLIIGVGLLACAVAGLVVMGTGVPA
jgi:hypothetical protein